MNRDQALRIIRWILMIVGGVALVGVIALGCFVACSFGPGDRDRADSASPSRMLKKDALMLREPQHERESPCETGRSAHPEALEGWGERLFQHPASDAAFVLNWCELGAGRIERVVHSYVSARSLTGDHLDGYAIKVTKLDPAELTPGERGHGGWYRGDQLPKVVDEAVGFLESWLPSHKLRWFPSAKALRSDGYYVYLVTVEFHGIAPSETEVIFASPADRMVYYFSGKT